LSPVPSDAGKSAPPRILIVDDDAGQRSLLNSFLATQGFQTVLASSANRRSNCSARITSA